MEAGNRHFFCRTGRETVAWQVIFLLKHAIDLPALFTTLQERDPAS
jgi:hypothetical protein